MSSVTALWIHALQPLVPERKGHLDQQALKAESLLNGALQIMADQVCIPAQWFAE